MMTVGVVVDGWSDDLDGSVKLIWVSFVRMGEVIRKLLTS